MNQSKDSMQWRKLRSGERIMTVPMFVEQSPHADNSLGRQALTVMQEVAGMMGLGYAPSRLLVELSYGPSYGTIQITVRERRTTTPAPSTPTGPTSWWKRLVSEITSFLNEERTK